MANEILGACQCPLCHADGAEIKRGEKGALYIKCDDCVSLIRTQSRRGRNLIAAKLPEDKRAEWIAPAPAPKPDTPPAEGARPAPSVAPAETAPKPEPKPAPKPAAKKPVSWLGIEL